MGDCSTTSKFNFLDQKNWNHVNVTCGEEERGVSSKNDMRDEEAQTEGDEGEDTKGDGKTDMLKE